MISIRAELVALSIFIDDHNELNVATNSEPYLSISFVENREQLAGRAVYVEVGYDSLPFKLNTQFSVEDHINAMSVNTVNTLKDMLRNGKLTHEYLESVRLDHNKKIAVSLGVQADIDNIVNQISPSVLQSISVLKQLENRNE